MRVCTDTHNYVRSYGPEKAIEVLAAAGFESIDWSMFRPDGILEESEDAVRRYFSAIREKADACGITVYQTHAPLTTYTGDPEKDPAIYEAIKKALLATSVLGAHHSVVHPPILSDNRYGSLAKENKELAMNFYGGLIPYLDEYGVSIAIENMYKSDPLKKMPCPTVCSSPYELNDYVDTLNGMCKNGDRFVVCLDVGHANLSCREMNIRDFIGVLGHRLKGVHIHDTDGLHDLHTAPGFGNVDWASFCLGLKDVGYDGDFVFEANAFAGRFDGDLLPDVTALLYKIGRRMCEKYGL